MIFLKLYTWSKDFKQGQFKEESYRWEYILQEKTKVAESIFGNASFETYFYLYYYNVRFIRKDLVN